MAKIFIYGRKACEYADALKAKGYQVRVFRSLDALSGNIASAGMLVLDGADNDARKAVAAECREIPKVLLFEDVSTPAGWLAQPMAYPLHSPTPSAFLKFINRLLAESAIVGEHRELGHKLSGAMSEIDFLEEMGKVLATATSPMDIYTTILRHVKKISGAAGYAYYMSEKDTNIIMCKKALGKAKKHIPGERSKRCLAHDVSLRSKPVRIGKDRQDISPLPPSYSNGKFQYIGVPVVIESKVAAVLELYSEWDDPPLTRVHTDLLAKFAALAAHAVEKIDLQQRLEELVITDDLTNLFNTRYLHRTLDTEIQRSTRYSMSVSVIFMDLDHFKDVNDLYGHLVGSKLLAEIGQLLMGMLRNLDIVARYGGDEFVMVLPQTELYNALVIADRIRKRIEGTKFLRKEGMSLRVTGSFGVAAYPETARSKEDLIRIADESMYNVKKNTRNGVYAII